MNVQDIIIRAIQENYNNPGSSNDFLTPVQVAHWIDAAVIEYWGIFQDNEYSYYSVTENVLNINPYFNIYALPNGDPAQSDQITFSDVPITGAYTINYNQHSVSYNSGSLPYNASAATIQNAINSQAGPKCTVTANWNVTAGLGNQIAGFTILWDTSTIPIANTGNGPVTYSAFTNTTGVTIMATPGVANIYAQKIAFISEMANRTGTAPNYGYTPVATVQPRSQFGTTNGVMSAVLAYTQNQQGIGNGWCLAGGGPDGNGIDTLNIKVVGWPLQSATWVYNGLRYPTKVPFTSATSPLTTYVPDVPEHFHYGLVLRVLKAAYLRAKADTTDIERMIKDFDITQCAVESRSVQRQGPDMIEDIGKW